MIIIDIETTGLDERTHAILSVGAIDFLDPKRMFYEECRAWDGAEVHPQALEVNGFTMAQVFDPKKQSVQELLKKFLDWAQGCEERTIAGENVAFDRDFLKVNMERLGLPWFFGHRVVDLHSISFARLKGLGVFVPHKNAVSALNMNKTLNYVGLADEPSPHHALMGAKLEAEAFSRLIHGKNLLAEFAHVAVPLHVKK